MKNTVTDDHLALKISEEKQEEVVEGEPGNEDPAADKKREFSINYKSWSYVHGKCSRHGHNPSRELHFTNT